MLDIIKDVLIRQLVDSGYAIKSIVPYKDFAFLIYTDKTAFVISYKSSWYHKFNKHFTQLGEGQIFSRDIVFESAEKDAILCFGFSNMEIYVINPWKILKYGIPISHIPDHLAISRFHFKKLDDYLQEQYLEAV